MNRYVITITADNDGAAGPGVSHTTIRIDTSSGQARITEVTISAPSGGGLAPTDLPAMDLNLLVRALTAAEPRAVNRGQSQQQRRAAGAEPDGAAPAPSAPPRVPESTAPSSRSRVRQPSSGRAAARTSRTVKSTASGATRTRAATAGSGVRAYRRMPAPEQVMDVYREAGTITGVAEHFEVPRHTAAGWARRLRALGYTIGRQ
ncbi:hypothetical protein [Micromonospora sp. CPCC 206061]|uniref:hypothetical protein n=1 Tax=Micromonospora sp. CPCC 206061 TaxID=3122410 RepID=UPI002FF06CA1